MNPIPSAIRTGLRRGWAEFRQVLTMPEEQSFNVVISAVILADAAAAVEIAESWRTGETISVLGAWALVGLVLAPVVLRRIARRESGASVAARRQKATQRIG